VKFKPFGKKYTFARDVLIRDFPDFMGTPIASWFWEVLRGTPMVRTSVSYPETPWLTEPFRDSLQVRFREVFPLKWEEALLFILSDRDRITNFITLCLQNFADQDNADELEFILSQGGSAYEVIKKDKSVPEYAKGGYEIAERVNEVTQKQSEQALEDNELIREAWDSCFSRSPDYERVVSRSNDFLEAFLGKAYFPNDTTPQLKKFVHAFENSPEILDYKGDSVVNPKSNLTSLLKKASDIRGQHTAGKGRKPTKEEAEFVLHTIIYIWNLHQK